MTIPCPSFTGGGFSIGGIDGAHVRLVTSSHCLPSARLSGLRSVPDDPLSIEPRAEVRTEKQMLAVLPETNARHAIDCLACRVITSPVTAIIHVQFMDA